MKWFFVVCVAVDFNGFCSFGYLLERPHDTEQACKETAADFLEKNPEIPAHAASCKAVQVAPELDA